MLGSAAAHSGMTLLTKQAQDKLVFRGLTLAFVGLAFLPWLLTQPLPPWEVWRFLLAGAVVIWAYNMLMIAAFSHGEMNLAYPVMRGSAPALAALAAFVFLRETVSPGQLLGLAIACAALIGLCLAGARRPAEAESPAPGARRGLHDGGLYRDRCLRGARERADPCLSGMVFRPLDRHHPPDGHDPARMGLLAGRETRGPPRPHLHRVQRLDLRGSRSTPMPTLRWHRWRPCASCPSFSARFSPRWS